MPPFGAQPNALNSLNDVQIAQLSNWILKHYGNADVTVTEKQVAEIRRGGPSSPLVMLAQVGIGLGAAIVIVLLAWWFRRRRE